MNLFDVCLSVVRVFRQYILDKQFEIQGHKKKAGAQKLLRWSTLTEISSRLEGVKK